MLEALRLVVNHKKSLLILLQKMEILGFLVNAPILHLIFPTKKLRKIQQLAQHLLHQQISSVRDLTRFVGKASASMKVIWQAPLHYRAPQFLIHSVMPKDHCQLEYIAIKFEANLRLTRETENDLMWWISLDRKVPM